MDEIKTSMLYSLEHTIAAELLAETIYPWEALGKIGEFIVKMGNTLSKEEYYSPKENVWISNDANVAQSANINEPCIICKGADIRHCAFIRGNAIVGRSCVVGNSSELKNCILFDNVQVPHFNYVGDSILGWYAHMGAGAVISNLKNDKTLVKVKLHDSEIETGLKKLGAMIGDKSEIGCNSVLNPGTVIGKNASVYPLSRVRGYVPSESIYKSSEDIVKKLRQNN